MTALNTNNNKVLGAQMEAPKESNVIQFRSANPSQMFLNRQDAKDVVAEVKTEFCDDIAEFTMDQVNQIMQQFGAMVDPKRINVKDMMLIESAIQGALYRYYGLTHPIHDVVEDIQELEDELEDE